MTSICLHGPESTGKSTLATRLGAHFGCEVVPEYGRAYCEANGTDITMAALVHIAQTQAAMNASAITRMRDNGKGIVIFDTDPLITAVWARMMFGVADPWFGQTHPTADLYLLLDIDLPFVDDGLRVYSDAAQRQHFFELCGAELSAHAVPAALVQGEGGARFAAALAAIETHRRPC